MTDRPSPPEALVDEFAPAAFVRDHDLESWINRTFIDDGADLRNPEHGHLGAAQIRCLWTSADARSKGRTILATAEMPRPKGWGFAKARQEVQLRELLGGDPDFLLTFSAFHSARMDDASFCALVEHELYHCGQATDRWGAPRFTREGRPVFTLRGHDVEEFVGVVRRYGSKASGRATTELVAAANREPEVVAADIAGACGNCARKA